MVVCIAERVSNVFPNIAGKAVSSGERKTAQEGNSLNSSFGQQAVSGYRLVTLFVGYGLVQSIVVLSTRAGLACCGAPS